MKKEEDERKGEKKRRLAQNQNKRKTDKQRYDIREGENNKEKWISSRKDRSVYVWDILLDLNLKIIEGESHEREYKHTSKNTIPFKYIWKINRIKKRDYWTS